MLKSITVSQQCKTSKLITTNYTKFFTLGVKMFQVCKYIRNSPTISQKHNFHPITHTRLTPASRSPSTHTINIKRFL